MTASPLLTLVATFGIVGVGAGGVRAVLAHRARQHTHTTATRPVYPAVVRFIDPQPLPRWFLDDIGAKPLEVGDVPADIRVVGRQLSINGPRNIGSFLALNVNSAPAPVPDVADIPAPGNVAATGPVPLYQELLTRVHATGGHSGMTGYLPRYVDGDAA